MKVFMKYLLIFLFIGSHVNAQTNFTRSYGGIIRGDTSMKNIALIFSADIDGEGVPFIDSTLHSMRINGSFFFTGNFLVNKSNRKPLKRLIDHGNYVGSHSYGHLLYCDWTRRDSLLLDHADFLSDLEKSYNTLKKFGIEKQEAKYFLPPYEWYNDTIASWARGFGLQVINFTPGTYSNADYTTPDMGKKYLPSDTIYNRILRFEVTHRNGLNGFLLLVHAGSNAARTDKFYWKLPSLITELRKRGYRFVRVDELLKN